MATKLLHPQIATSHVIPSSIPTLLTMIRSQTKKSTSTNHPIHSNFTVPRSNFAIKVSESSSSLVDDQEEEEEGIATNESPIDYSTIGRIKTDINKAMQG